MTVPMLTQSLAMLAAIAVMLRILLGQIRTEFRGEIRLLDTRIDGLETHLNARFDGLIATMDARFGTVDHRLTSVEADMSLAKGHLISQRATG